MNLRPVTLTTCLAAAAIYCINLACTGPSSQTPKSFSIGMVTFAGYAPLYLAKEKGFFGDLDVQLKRIEEIPNIRAAMARKEIDAYLATPDIALDTNVAPPGRAIWAIDESAGGDGVILADATKNGVTSLRGKKVAAEPGLPPNFLLLYFLYQNGMSLKDVSYQDMTTQNAATAFIAGSVDAAGIYQPYLSEAAAKRPGSKVVLSSKELPGVIVDLIFAQEELVSQTDPRISRVIQGWRKAIQYINDKPEDAYPVMAKSLNLSVASFRDTVSGIRWLDLSDNRRLFGSVDSPGPLSSAFGQVLSVLQKNRQQVYPAAASDYVVRKYVLDEK